jgi:hypothetical protein
MTRKRNLSETLSDLCQIIKWRSNVKQKYQHSAQWLTNAVRVSSRKDVCNIFPVLFKKKKKKVLQWIEWPKIWSETGVSYTDPREKKVAEHHYRLRASEKEFLKRSLTKMPLYIPVSIIEIGTGERHHMHCFVFGKPWVKILAQRPVILSGLLWLSWPSPDKCQDSTLKYATTTFFHIHPFHYSLVNLQSDAI